MAGTLYLVGTPIGNLDDLSPRAREVLSAADFIAAEDTRVTLKLLNRFGIRKPLVSYYEHNKHASGEKILERLLAGESCALVTDAGMPAVSDPGEDMVALCAEHGVPVSAAPGPSALITALALSGLPTGRFAFEGFLSTSGKSRMEHLESLRTERRTLIFYEAPHKLLRTLQDLLRVLGDRRVALCRELTKLHEEVVRTTLAEAAARYAAEEPRGEFVLVVEGAPASDEPEMSREAAMALLQKYRGEGRSLKEAARLAAAESGFSKNELYALAVSQTAQ